MSLYHRRCDLGLAVACAIFAFTATATAQEDGDTERARLLFDQGSQAYNEGRYETALTLLNESHRISGRPELLFNIANTLERLGRTAEAVEHLRRYLPDAPPENRRSIEVRIRALEARMARTPDVPAATQTQADVPPKASASANTRSRETKPKRPVPWRPIVLFSVAAAALASGITLGVLSRNRNDDAEGRCTNAIDRGTLCSSTASSDLDRARTYGIVADVSYGVAAAAATAATVLLIVNRKRKDTTDRPAPVTAGIMPGGGAVTVQRRF